MAGALACGGATDPTPVAPDYSVTRIGGEAQSGPAGSELEQPLAVEIRDPAGALARGVAVRFRLVSSHGATLLDTLVATGLDGVGRSRLRLGDRDSVIVAAAVRGQDPLGVTFHATTLPAIVVRAVEPAAFVGGDTVSVRGGRFTVDGRGIDVLFGGTRGRVVSASDTLVRVIVPPCLARGATAVAVRASGVVTSSVTVDVSGTDRPITLRVGEGVVVRGADLSCIRLGTAGQRFILVPQFVSGDVAPVASTFLLDVASGAFVADAPAVDPLRAALTTASPPSFRASFDHMLRAEEHELAIEGVAASEPNAHGAQPSLLRASVAPAPPTIGSARSFQVLSNLTGGSFTTVSARLRYIGGNLLIYEDITAPAPLAADQMQRLGDLFDNTLYRLDVVTFGAESDIDANGRVIVLMTPVVNAITPSAQCGVTGYVPGFFYGLDLTTRNINSNRAEIFYSMVADPQGLKSCVHRTDDVLSLIPSTFAHEFQHMISFNQHVIVRKGPDEATWLNEGLSHIAEELGARYFDDRYPAPTGRAVSGQLLSDSAFAFVRGNLDDAYSYLSNPSIHSVTAFQDFGTLEERGAAWLFLHWLGTQKGDAVFGRLEQTSLTNRANVEASAGESFDGLFGDFSLTLYADSIPNVARSVVPSRYRFGQRTLRELLTRGLGRVSYPLAVRSAPSAGSSITASMVQGTASYFQLTVPTAGATVRLTGATGTPAPSAAGAQLGIVRITP